MYLAQTLNQIQAKVLNHRQIDPDGTTKPLLFWFMQKLNKYYTNSPKQDGYYKKVINPY